ncbi:MAG: lipoyl synthase [Elusimicrobia bacterium]|nr:lipoyl synthase [Elusimicrobiota bacterium]
MMLKPAWLDKKISLRECYGTGSLLSGLGLNTICAESLCPNISECYSRGYASFMILGRTCTRSCRFCNVDKGVPDGICADEGERIAKAVLELGLKHVVITSPTRDDLPDGGAGAFSRTVRTLRRNVPGLVIELLIPDFYGDPESINAVAASEPDIAGHNLETVSRLYHIRAGADYARSLEVLRILKKFNCSLKTKSGIMVGLGETQQEVLGLMRDLLGVGCRYMSIGQYLSPGRNHHPVTEYIEPGIFRKYRAAALDMGFIHVESAPYVRSSYMADRYLSADVREVSPVT